MTRVNLTMAILNGSRENFLCYKLGTKIPFKQCQKHFPRWTRRRTTLTDTLFTTHHPLSWPAFGAASVLPSIIQSLSVNGGWSRAQKSNYWSPCHSTAPSPFFGSISIIFSGFINCYSSIIITVYIRCEVFSVIQKYLQCCVLRINGKCTPLGLPRKYIDLGLYFNQDWMCVQPTCRISNVCAISIFEWVCFVRRCSISIQLSVISGRNADGDSILKMIHQQHLWVPRGLQMDQTELWGPTPNGCFCSRCYLSPQ